MSSTRHAPRGSTDRHAYTAEQHAGTSSPGRDTRLTRTCRSGASLGPIIRTRFSTLMFGKGRVKRRDGMQVSPRAECVDQAVALELTRLTALVEMYRYLYPRCQSTTLAEDLTSESVLAASEEAAVLEDTATPSSLWSRLPRRPATNDDRQDDEMATRGRSRRTLGTRRHARQHVRCRRSMSAAARPSHPGAHRRANIAR